VRATVVLPVKRFAHAKTRLAEAVGPPGRAALMKAMLADSLAALAAAELVDRVVVVTGEGRAERVGLDAARGGSLEVEVLQEPEDHGHSAAAVLGIVRALALGAECSALLPGDCPFVDARELDGALGRMEPGRVAVVPDRHGTGTNALLLAPADAIGPAFGEGSCERHLDRATRAGFEAVREELPSLALDLDTPEDLDALRQRAEAEPAAAPRTAAALAAL
jgi:2-phospho-L-lactate guanylyltransferase